MILIDAKLDPATKTITWTLTSIDPTTVNSSYYDGQQSRLRRPGATKWTRTTPFCHTGPAFRAVFFTVSILANQRVFKVANHRTSIKLLVQSE